MKFYKTAENSPEVVVLDPVGQPTVFLRPVWLVVCSLTPNSPLPLSVLMSRSVAPTDKGGRRSSTLHFHSLWCKQVQLDFASDSLEYKLEKIVPFFNLNPQ